jgi:crossover junction endodeoxyribonuclease RusA
MPVIRNQPPFATYRYELPFPPSINDYWGENLIRQGKRQFKQKYLKEKATKFRKAVLQMVKRRPNTRRRLAVTVTLVMPDERERDMDNYNKGLLDALQHAQVYEKDSQIDDLRIIRGHTASPGAALVEIREIGYAKTTITIK